MFRFETAGESHGECLVATLTGLPAGIPIALDAINHELWRRQQGYGRGGRMKIETDRASMVSGVRHGRTIGSPIAMIIANADWKNWTESLPVEEGDPAKHKPVSRPRPGHADLAGAIKYNLPDARYILERASARETTARVAVGAVVKQFLGAFRHRSPEPRDRRRPQPPRAHRRMGRNGRAEPPPEVLLGCVDPDAGTGNESWSSTKSTEPATRSAASSK